MLRKIKLAVFWSAAYSLSFVTIMLLAMFGLVAVALVAPVLLYPHIADYAKRIN